MDIMNIEDKKDEIAADGYICEVCCKVFTSENAIRNHRERVHSDKRFACHLCDKVLKTREAIKKHIASIHTGERNYICKHCGKAFSDASSRNSHEKYQHPPVGQEIVCKECGKQFKYPRGLRLHMVHHNQATPYDGQRKQYSNELKLEALKWVTEIGAAETAKKFNVPYSAVRNWMDSMKRNYLCHTCDKSFQSKQRLEEHERVTHSAQAMTRGKGFKFSPEFKQEVCDYAQATSNKEACEKYSLGESTVRGFVKLLLNPIHCPHCSRKCKNQSQLTKHMDEVHKVGHYQPNTDKKESLTSFLETENIDKQELTESMTYQSRMQKTTQQEVDPSNIEVYDPTKPREVKPKEVKVKKKRVRKKQVKVIKEESGDEEENVVVKRIQSREEEHEGFKKNKAIFLSRANKSGAVARQTIGIDPTREENIETIKMEMDENTLKEEVFENVGVKRRRSREEENEGSKINKVIFDTTSEENIETIKMEMDENTVKEEVFEEEEGLEGVDYNEIDTFSDVDYPDNGGELEDMDPDDLLKPMNDSGNLKVDPVKSERLSTNMKEEADSEDDVANDISFLEDNSDVQLDNPHEPHIGNSSLKTDIEGDNDNDQDYKVLASPINNEKKPATPKNSKMQKDPSTSPKRVRAFNPKPEHLVDFNIDLTQFEINENEEEFVIQSKFTNVEQFMDVILSKKYKSKKKIFSCSECSKRFKNPCDFKRHMTTHTSEKNFLCEFCFMAFSFKSNLVRHIQKQHEEEGLNERFKCQYCPNEYKDRSSLKTHERRHTEGPQPHQCPICGKGYAAIQSLEDHIKYVHEGETPPKHICPVCGKEFKKIQNLKAHHRSHLFGKEFQCDQCEKAFMQKDTLRQHKTYHCKNADSLQLQKKREEKKQRFACEMCEKVYGDKRNLMNHIQIIHEGKTDNFVCDVCSKSFSRKTSLVAHKMLHTGEFKIFNCEHCNASFKDKRYYVRHREKCHTLE